MYFGALPQTRFLSQMVIRRVMIMTGTPSGRRNQPVCLACGFSRLPWPPAARAAGKRAPGQPHLAASFGSSHYRTVTLDRYHRVSHHKEGRRAPHQKRFAFARRYASRNWETTLGLPGTVGNGRNHQTRLLTLYAHVGTTCGVMEQRNVRIEPRTHMRMSFYHDARYARVNARCFDCCCTSRQGGRKKNNCSTFFSY